jgi:hypothetical protein
MAAGSLAGRSASGTLGTATNLLSFHFQAGGGVTGTSRQDQKKTGRTFTGSYTFDGTRITIRMAASSFEGTVSGNTISGTRARSDGLNDTWSVTLD